MFTELLLPWKTVSITCFCVCVCVCVCARAHGCVRVCVLMHSWAGACSLTYPQWKAHVPYCHFRRPLWLHHMFRHYLINCTIFWKKVTEHKMSVVIFSTVLSEIGVILREFSEILSQMWKRLHVKYPLLLSAFNETLVFSRYFQRSHKYQI